MACNLNNLNDCTGTAKPCDSDLVKNLAIARGGCDKVVYMGNPNSLIQCTKSADGCANGKISNLPTCNNLPLKSDINDCKSLTKSECIDGCLIGLDHYAGQNENKRQICNNCTNDSCTVNGYCITAPTPAPAPPPDTQKDEPSDIVKDSWGGYRWMHDIFCPSYNKNLDYWNAWQDQHNENTSTGRSWYVIPTPVLGILNSPSVDLKNHYCAQADMDTLKGLISDWTYKNPGTDIIHTWSSNDIGENPLAKYAGGEGIFGTNGCQY